MGQLGLSRVNYVFVFCLVQIIAEGANGPTTPDADKVFLENNVMVIPVSTQAHTQECKLKHFAVFRWKHWKHVLHSDMRPI